MLHNSGMHRAGDASRLSPMTTYSELLRMKHLFPVVLVLSTGCGMAGAPPTAHPPAMERTLIVGSAETPDPVLDRVRELEARGVVKDVVVYESFPVQIRLSAPRRVIDELNRIPRADAAGRTPRDPANH